MGDSFRGVEEDLRDDLGGQTLDRLRSKLTAMISCRGTCLQPECPVINMNKILNKDK